MRHKASMKVSLDMAGVIVWDAVKPMTRAELTEVVLLAENDPPEISLHFTYDDGAPVPASVGLRLSGDGNIYHSPEPMQIREDSVSIGGTD